VVATLLALLVVLAHDVSVLVLLPLLLPLLLLPLLLLPLALVVAVVGFAVGHVPVAVGVKPPKQTVNGEEPGPGIARSLEPGVLHDTLNSVSTNNAVTIQSSADIFMSDPLRDTPM
jgi:hypothetical protein